MTTTLQPFANNGTRVVFISDDNTEGWSDLYIANVDGSNVVRLTKDARSKSWPAPTPDGSWVYFTTVESESEFRVVRTAR